jgi:hypothetical protein
VIRRRFAPLLAFVLLLLPTSASSTARAADPIEVAWTAPPLEATTRAVPQFVDATDDAVFVAGALDGALQGQTSLGNADGFVARFDTDGNLLWARHIGTSGTDYLTSLVVTSAGVFVAGRTSSRVEEGTFHDREGFVAFMTLSGDGIWQFAEMDPGDFPVRLAPMAGGGVIAGMTGWLDLPAPDTRRKLFYRHFLPNGTITWEDEILGWWTDDVDVDATGITVSGQQPGTSSGEGIVRRYGLDGNHLWTKTMVAAFTSDMRILELASTGSAIWAAGIGLVPIDGSPGVWPDDERFVRRFAVDGSTVWTKAINAHRIIADCGSFVGVGEIVPDDPNIRRGGYVARFDPDGSETWRWTQPGSETTRINFIDIATRGDRAYLIKEEITGGDPAVVRLVALDNLPQAPACATLDTIPPTATAPTNRLVNGSAISGGRTTVRLAWTGSDATSGVDRFELAQSTDGGGWTSVSTSLTATSLDRALAHGHAYRFRVRAVDEAGNVGAWMTGPTFRLTHYGESSANLKYSGTWSTSTSSVYWGGKAKASSQAGAKASLTFTGRSVELVSRKGPARGKAHIYINGVLKAAVDLYASSYQNQRVVWTGSWSSSATRTITVRVAGTAGRPRVDLDAFVVGS